MGADGEEEPEHEFAIETARLMLRRLVPADRQAVATLSANAAVAENLCSALSPDDRGGFVVAERAQGAVVGFAGHGPTHDMPGSVEVCLWIGMPWWGRGYATEAAQALVDHAFATEGLNALWCSNRVTNTRARRVIEKCGFQFRGTGMVRSPTYFGAFPVERFVLDRRNWTSLRAWGAPLDSRSGGRRETAA